jgi:hypothetical protein
MTPDEKDLHWLVRPATIRKLWIGGGVVLAALVLADALIHPHALFRIDGTFGFYAWYGLVTCMAMVLAAKGLGVFLKRRDDYYAEGSAEGSDDD